jgi:adenylosuccinate synthase
LHHTTAELTELRGWQDDLGECCTFSDLPEAAREYLQFIAEQIGAPVTLVGVGPGREQVIWTDAGKRTNLGQGSWPAQSSESGAHASDQAPV